MALVTEIRAEWVQKINQDCFLSRKPQPLEKTYDDLTSLNFQSSTEEQLNTLQETILKSSAPFRSNWPFPGTGFLPVQFVKDSPELSFTRAFNFSPLRKTQLLPIKAETSIPNLVFMFQNEIAQNLPRVFFQLKLNQFPDQTMQRITLMTLCCISIEINLWNKGNYEYQSHQELKNKYVFHL